MKTFSTFALVALSTLTMASCQKANPVETVPDGFRKVRFTVEGLNTKLTSFDKEKSVNSIQVSVFDKNGNYVTGGQNSGSTLELNVPVGVDSFKVCALANSKNKVYDINTIPSLLACKSEFGKADGLLEMFSLREDAKLESGSTCSLKVKRFVAKVEIDAVKDSISYGHTLSLDRIYLINVGASADFKFNADPSAMVYRQLGGFNPSETDIVAFTKDTVGYAFSDEELYSTPHFFYCYPNPTVTETGSARFTRLVVEATLNGSKYYYPVNITGGGEGISSNKLYKVTQMTITGPGSLSPDTPVSKQNLTFNIEVLDWDNGTSQAVVI